LRVTQPTDYTMVALVFVGPVKTAGGTLMPASEVRRLYA
jgi:hypothetical protein